MSKARVDWAFNEVLTSSKHDEQTTDYLTRGQLICSTVGLAEDQGATALPLLIHFPPYPFNPAKQVFDRMRILGIVRTEPGAGGTYGVRYTLDSGASFATTTLPDAAPFAMVPPQGASGTTVDVGPGQATIDISGIAAFQWIGIAIERGGSSPTWVTWSLAAFLYLSTDDPF
ncbi:MAG: hypothetical protein R3344_06460 [Acidobacteriota bacterium]|nr:hypothetical protein [Acidobacteriota bacterium]